MPKEPKMTEEELAKLAGSTMGRKGGKGGTGDAKRRTPQHYQKLTEARRKAIFLKRMKDK